MSARLEQNYRRERLLLQMAVTVASLVPIATGLDGIVFGPTMLGTEDGANIDSHFRYLSGLLLAIGLAFLSLVSNIETETLRFRLLTFLVFAGGLGRLVSFTSVGKPGGIMLFGLAMELVVTPMLCLWQSSLARRFRGREIEG